ncbi:MAG: hypothetical protein IKG14_06235 [Clostridia bacterium]|nr:hypothetical protein [Clostridia bacterium]
MNKKITIITSILAIIILISLTLIVFEIRSGINKNLKNTQVKQTAQTNAKTEEQTTQLANPLTQVNSETEMEKTLGYDVPVLNKEVNSYTLIANYHARIVYKDTTQFEMEKGDNDVSGIYGGKLQNEETIKNVKIKFYTYEDINYANWTKDGFSYSYSNKSGEVSKTEIENLIK